MANRVVSILEVVWWAALVSAIGGGALPAQSRARPWRASARLGGELRYDDNPFLLSTDQKSRLAQPSAADSQSGRFRDMENARDLIPVPAFEVGMSGPGLFRRTLALKAEGVYEANVENARRRHAELGFAVQQDVSGSGRLRLRADVLPNYFWKNYLQDGVDLNGNGNIGSAERRYAAGSSDEADVSASYRHRLVKPAAGRPIGFTGQLELSYFTRQYEAPFAYRSLRGPGVGAGLAVDLGTSWSFGLDGSYARETADTARAVLILDETGFGRDFNNNGRTTDVAARAYEIVDLSRTEKKFGVSLRGDLGTAVSGEVGYDRRVRDYTSIQPYDVAHRGRRDSRNEVTVGLDVRLASGLRLALAARRAVQDTNRAGDPASTGEVVAYMRQVATAGLQYRF